MFDKTPSLPFPIDVERFLYDANSLFNPLHKDFILDYHVSSVKDGNVYLSLAMPEGMTRVFMSLLESLTGLFRVIDIKAVSKAAQVKCIDPAEIMARKERQDDFQSAVCSVFDDLIRQGVSVKDAIKQTNSTLKAQGSPWATYEVVSSVLRSSRRLRKKKGVIK